MIKINRIIFFFFLTALLAQGCVKSIDYEAQEQKAIQEFLAKNNITTPPTESGLYYLVKTEGTGQQPVDSDTVSINYIVSYLDGVVFDTNIEEVAQEHNIYNPQRDYVPFVFVKGSNEAIEGVDEGVGYMKEGGEAILVIPSSLAYHAYNPLVFYVKLLEVKHDTTTTAR
jgi:FKBP-type peptidyl-prolyl cis-trans isomerase